MPHNKERQFTVEGRMPFPIDMLRYDACHPVGSDDALNITCSLDPSYPRQERPFRVTLSSRAFQAPTIGRWESFMWKVVS